MEIQELKSPFGKASFQRRRHPRFSVDFPIEYYQVNSRNRFNGRVLNASEGGLMVNLPETLEVNRYLITKLFFIFDRHLNSAEIFARVVWRDIHFGEGLDFRAGLRIVGISPEDMNRWRNFLNNFSELEIPSNLSQ
jgi:hypothetical protein